MPNLPEETDPPSIDPIFGLSAVRNLMSSSILTDILMMPRETSYLQSPLLSRPITVDGAGRVEQRQDLGYVLDPSLPVLGQAPMAFGNEYVVVPQGRMLAMRGSRPEPRLADAVQWTAEETQVYRAHRALLSEAEALCETTWRLDDYVREATCSYLEMMYQFGLANGRITIPKMTLTPRANQITFDWITPNATIFTLPVPRSQISGMQRSQLRASRNSVTSCTILQLADRFLGHSDIIRMPLLVLDDLARRSEYVTFRLMTDLPVVVIPQSDRVVLEWWMGLSCFSLEIRPGTNPMNYLSEVSGYPYWQGTFYPDSRSVDMNDAFQKWYRMALSHGMNTIYPGMGNLFAMDME